MKCPIEQHQGDVAPWLTTSILEPQQLHVGRLRNAGDAAAQIAEVVWKDDGVRDTSVRSLRLDRVRCPEMEEDVSLGIPASEAGLVVSNCT